jgi:hypothetical protein
MLKAATRPLRACCYTPTCSILIGGLVMAGIMLWLTISGIVEPIIFSNRIWEPARCTFAGEMTFERVHRRKGPDGYRVIAPVTVSYAGNSWDLIGHRYPHRSMTDSVKAELFDWWMSIGGTGTVVEEPTDGWFGSPGVFEFTTPIGQRVPCWVLPSADPLVSAPTSVKLSDAELSMWGLYFSLVLMILMVVVLIFGVACVAAMSCDEYSSTMSRLELTDESEATSNKQLAPPALRRTNSRAGRLLGARAIQRSNSHFSLSPDEYYDGTHRASIRNGFLRKVYGIITAQVLVTVAVTLIFMCVRSSTDDDAAARPFGSSS